MHLRVSIVFDHITSCNYCFKSISSLGMNKISRNMIKITRETGVVKQLMDTKRTKSEEEIGRQTLQYSNI